MLILSGCSKERQVEKHFEEILNMYPTPNLEDWYEREGYRDGDFRQGDKGTWVLHSSMSKGEGDYLITEGMILRINRNDNVAKGHYYINKITKANLDFDEEKKQYSVKMKDNKIIPTEKVPDTKIKEKIERFKFLSQFGKFKDLSEYPQINFEYNAEAPRYSIEYQMTNSDGNVEKLRKIYNINTKDAPKLLLQGSGNLKGSSVGYRHIEYTFARDNKNIYFKDSVSYQPSKENIK